MIKAMLMIPLFCLMKLHFYDLLTFFRGLGHNTQNSHGAHVMCQYSTSTTRLFLYTGNVVRPKMVDIYKTTCYWRMKPVSLQACCPPLTRMGQKGYKSERNLTPVHVYFEPPANMAYAPLNAPDMQRYTQPNQRVQGNSSCGLYSKVVFVR